MAIVHDGSVVALASPRRCSPARRGDPRVPRRREPRATLAHLQDRGIAGDDAFAIGARLTVPLHGHAAGDALAAIESERVRASEIATRAPTLDDVYLQLTGGTLRDAA